MYIDGAMQFTGVAGTVSGDTPTTGTQVSTNVLDLRDPRDIGIGDDPALKLAFRVLTPFTGGTSLQVNIQGAPDNAGVPGVWTTYITGPVIAEAQLIQGAWVLAVDMPRPPAGAPLPRFLRAQYVSVGTHTAGAIHGALVLDRPDEVYYRPGIVINN